MTTLSSRRYLVTIHFTNDTNVREILSGAPMTTGEAFRMALADMRAMPGPGFTGDVERWEVVEKTPSPQLIIAPNKPVGYVTPSAAAKIAAAGWCKLLIGIRREKSEDSTVAVFMTDHPSK